jgi:hypothetical protein
MTEDYFPDLVSDPEAKGLPGVADDDSTAADEVDSPRQADGPEPFPLPLDRDDKPLGLDEFDPAREGGREPLDAKLARETPEPPVDEPDPMGDDASLDPAAAEQPNADSPVSMYDEGVGGRGTVGRLVEPDEGGPVDAEPDAVAYDAGAAGGGPSAEEAAIHEVPDR